MDLNVTSLHLPNDFEYLETCSLMLQHINMSSK
uniref:Uncharacterized protein n=1 Tax=Moniliophthora roreri TaxID=221103 RepID=A0A0W0FVU6_MONRR